MAGRSRRGETASGIFFDGVAVLGGVVLDTLRVGEDSIRPQRSISLQSWALSWLPEIVVGGVGVGGVDDDVHEVADRGVADEGEAVVGAHEWSEADEVAVAACQHEGLAVCAELGEPGAEPGGVEEGEAFSLAAEQILEAGIQPGEVGAGGGSLQNGVL